MSRPRRGWRWESAPTQAEVTQQQVNLDDRKSLRPEL